MAFIHCRTGYGSHVKGKESIGVSRPKTLQHNILRLTAECGVISRRAIGLLPYSYSKTNDALRNLIAEEKIAKKGKGKDKYYVILQEGKKALLEVERFIVEGEHVFEDYPYMDANTRAASWKRLLLIGKVNTMMIRAGYDTHPKIKIPFSPDWEREDYDSVVGSFYTAKEIKDSFRESMNNIRGSRICGLLVTADRCYRVYHSRDVAMEYAEKPEHKLLMLLYSRYVQLGFPQYSCTIIFGDPELQFARKVMDCTWGDYDEAKKLRKLSNGGRGAKTLLNANGLGIWSYYIPVRKEAAPLLELFRYKNKLKTFRDECLFSFAGDDEVYELRDGIYGIGEYACFFVADMNLPGFCSAVFASANATRDREIVLICFEWQEDFWKDIGERAFREPISLAIVEPLLLQGALEQLKQNM